MLRGISPEKYYENIMDLIPVSRGRGFNATMITMLLESSANSPRILVLQCCSDSRLSGLDESGFRMVDRFSLMSIHVGLQSSSWERLNGALCLCSDSLTAFNFEVSSPSLESMILQGVHIYIYFQDVSICSCRHSLANWLQCSFVFPIGRVCPKSKFQSLLSLWCLFIPTTFPFSRALADGLYYRDAARSIKVQDVCIREVHLNIRGREIDPPRRYCSEYSPIDFCLIKFIN